MKKRTKTLWIRHTLMMVAICLFLVGGKLFSWRCPFATIFHVPCPTCGVTRAMRCLVRLDFAGYRRYQPMAAFLCLAVLLAWDMDVFPRKKPIWAVVFFIVGVNFVWWGYRVFVA